VTAAHAIRNILLATLALAATAQAQQVPEPAPAPPTAPTPAPTDNVTTLGEVRALNPDEEPLDLYRFKNPIQPESNRFSRSWSEPPSPEQVSMSGGYLMMGINAALGAAGRGLHKITGGPDQIQSAIARPPPELTPEQQQRAQSLQDANP
jgi:hypothetical protein